MSDLTVHFDNLVLRVLPTAPLEDGSEPHPVRGYCFSRLKAPTPVVNPALIAYSVNALELIGWGAKEASDPKFTEFACGNLVLRGSEPAAQCYAGHQFGYFSGQLGDGAVAYLGEVVNAQGQRWELQLKGSGLTPYSRAADGRKVLRSSVREFLASEAMYHLGIPTTRSASVVTSDTRVERDPLYSGRPVRERATVITRIAPTFLRFGSFEICKHTDSVTGRAGPSAGLEQELLPKMVNFTIQTYFNDIWGRHGGDALAAGGDLAKMQPMYLEWFSEVVKRTASLVAGWQSVGFCHGVLNTDNMSILGLTIDYGPYGFLDRYDPHHVCNGSDDGARYTYAAQVDICKWNCEKLAEALSPVMPLTKGQMERELHAYDIEYDRCYLSLMRRKLGLIAAQDEGVLAGDMPLLQELFNVMKLAGSDFTNTFRLLADVELPSTSTSLPPHVDDASGGTAPDDDAAGGAKTPDHDVLQADIAGPNSAEGSQRQRADGATGCTSPSSSAQPPRSPVAAAAASVATALRSAALGGGGSGAHPDGGSGSRDGGGGNDPAAPGCSSALLEALMSEGSSPATMAKALGPRMSQENLQMLVMLAQRDAALLHQLGTSVQAVQQELERYKAAQAVRSLTPASKASADRARWTAWLQRYAVRLQLEVDAGATAEARRTVMNATNPRIVLRNWMAQAAIDKAEAGDYSEVRKLLDELRRPFAPAEGGVCAYRKVPGWASDLCVTCSS